MDDVTERAFPARLNCHYLLRTPKLVDVHTPLVVTLHGFGADPETMLGLTARLFGTQPVIASLQGPYQFFREPTNRAVGHGWITSKRPDESIRLHHEMVAHVLDEVGGEFDIPPARRLLAGFSQPVSLNYRFAATCPEAVRGVIAICGGLPSDWESGTYQQVSAGLLHIARRLDQYYPPNVTEHYAERLHGRAADVEFHLVDGGHQMPSNGNLIVEPWLRRILR
jgi:predicted esterase